MTRACSLSEKRDNQDTVAEGRRGKDSMLDLGEDKGEARIQSMLYVRGTEKWKAVADLSGMESA